MIGRNNIYLTILAFLMLLPFGNEWASMTVPASFHLEQGGFENFDRVAGNPEMDLFYGATALLNNDVTPTSGKGTDFGSTSCIASVTRRFTIKNNGSDTLRITLPISVTGTNAGDFTVTLNPALKVKAGDSTHVEITFAPSGSGVRTASVSITNDDTNENPYTFSIQGTGSLPEINVQGNSTSIPDGDTGPIAGDDTDFGSIGVCSGTNPNIFTIQNTGTVSLSVSNIVIGGANPGDFILSGFTPTVSVGAGLTTTFTVTFNPSATGTRTAIVTITNTDCNEGTYDFAIQGTGIDPEIDLRGNSTSIPDGDVTPIPGDDTDFGTVNVCSGTNGNTFTIHNTGTSSLSVTSVTSSNSTDFVVSGITPTVSISAGNTDNFTVTFDPTTSGTLTSTITVLSSDCDEATYTFLVQGVGQAPEIGVSGNSNAIADGSTTISSTNSTNVGSVNVCSGTVDVVYTITNTGNSSSTISSVGISGTNASNFSMVSQPSSPLAAGASTTFTVRFDPSAIGARNATLTFTNQDCDEATYTFDIRGTGIEPDVNVKGNNASIGDGDTSPSTSDHTDFGSMSTCSGIVTRVFTIENVGTDVLNITSMPVLSGAQAADYSITVMPSTPIAAGNSTTFTVVFNPSANGNRNAIITFFTDDCTPGSETEYTFEITGAGVDPEIEVKGLAVLDIPDGDVTPNALDGTDFGNVLACGTPATRTFTIKNTDNNAVLSVGAITFSGTNAADFTVTTNPSATVAPNDGTTTFVVTFDPSSAGTKNATISIVNGDCNENPFNFDLTGTATDPEADVLGNSVSITDGDITPDPADHTDFGTTPACGATVDRTFTIQNNGSSPLLISSTTVSPTTNFAIQTSPSASVAAGASTTFTVRYTPSNALATHSATVTVTSSDCNEGTYTFEVSGTTGIETVPPTATCQNFTAYLNASGVVTVAGSSLNNGSTDNCTSAGNLIFSSGGSYDCSDVGTPQNVVITVTDGFGNSTNCASKVITVLDTVKPVAVCRTATVQLNAAGTGSITAATIDNGSSDFCGIASMAASTTNFNCANVGSNNVTLTVTDVNGNVRTCATTVTVADTVKPNAVCRNVTIYLDNAGNASTTATAVDNASSDACGIATRVLNTTAFTCANIGINPVVLTVTDVNTNFRTCTANVIVVDSTRPNAVCQNQTIQLDASGNASISPSQIDNNSTDNCTLGSLILDVSQFDCNDVGTNNVTLVVPDQDNNLDSCVAVVTVQDQVDPVAICQDIFIELDTLTGEADILPSQINNNSSDACGIATMSLDSTHFTCSNVTDTNIVVLTVIDSHGNQDSCTALVSIIDNTAPNAVCASDTVYLDALGDGSTTPGTLSGTSGDACGGLTITLSQANFDCSDLGANTISVSVTDLNQNSSTCLASVLVQDTIVPVARCANVVITLNTLGSLTISPFFVDDNSYDNCSLPTKTLDRTVFTCSDVNTVTPVVLTVVDPSGLQDTCHATVTTRDYTLPNVTCNNLSLILDGNGNASTTLSAIQGTVSDACGIASVSINDSTFNCSDVGIVPVIMTVVDLSNNIRRCTSQVSISETQLPTANCQTAIVTLDSNGTGSITAASINNNSTDNCVIDSLIISQENFDCSHVGSNSVTLTVMDESGNSSSCVTTVTVQDNMNPWIACHDTTLNLVTGSTVTIPLTQLQDSVGDNCGVDTVTISQTTFDCANFGVNNVVLTVTDVNGNTGTCISQVTVLGAALTGTAVLNSEYCGFGVSCNGATDAMATVTSSGGCPPRSYAWSNGSTNDTITGIGAGTYFVTITDASGVTIEDTVVVTEPAAITITVVNVTQTCEGDTTGSIDLTIGGGNLCAGNLIHVWNTGDSTADLSNLAGGLTYTVTVTDPMGCSLTQGVPVNNFPTPNPSIVQLDSFLTCSPAFVTYQWFMNGDTIPGATSQTYTADTNGQYHVAVMSSDGCEGSSAPVTVTFTIIGVDPSLVAEFGLTLYPNPTPGVFNLMVSKPVEHPMLMQVTDLFGRVVMTENLPNLIDSKAFDASGLAAGTYMVTLTSKKFEPVTIRMVIQ